MIEHQRTSKHDQKHKRKGIHQISVLCMCLRCCCFCRSTCYLSLLRIFVSAASLRLRWYYHRRWIANGRTCIIPNHRFFPSRILEGGNINAAIGRTYPCAVKEKKGCVISHSARNNASAHGTNTTQTQSRTHARKNLPERRAFCSFLHTRTYTHSHTLTHTHTHTQTQTQTPLRTTRTNQASHINGK